MLKITLHKNQEILFLIAQIIVFVFVQIFATFTKFHSFSRISAPFWVMRQMNIVSKNRQYFLTAKLIKDYDIKLRVFTISEKHGPMHMQVIVIEKFCSSC